VRLQALSGDIEQAQAPLMALKDHMTALRRDVDELAASDPGGGLLAARRRDLAALEEKWDHETERVRRFLSAREQLHADGVRILTATGGKETTIREWDTLGALTRTRIARLATSPAP
jgi:hypothetical protein